MESKQPPSNPQDFLTSAAVLLLKSSVSITERCFEDTEKVFPSDADQSPMVREVLAFLSSIVLHEARAKDPTESAVDINQTCHQLKDALVPVTNLDSEYLRHSLCFDDQAFHELMANYFNGKIEGFQLQKEELEGTSELIGIPIPSTRGLESIFFALITRLLRLTQIDSISEETEQKKAAVHFTQLTETGVSSFGLALQLL